MLNMFCNDYTHVSSTSQTKTLIWIWLIFSIYIHQFFLFPNGGKVIFQLDLASFLLDLILTCIYTCFGRRAASVLPSLVVGWRLLPWFMMLKALSFFFLTSMMLKALCVNQVCPLTNQCLKKILITCPSSCWYGTCFPPQPQRRL
jgi:hypothetical protein